MTDSPVPPTYYLIRNLSEGAIEVLRLYDSDSHTLREYVLASRNTWQTAQEATAYGIQLAAENELNFKHDQHLDPESYQESMYLD